MESEAQLKYITNPDYSDSCLIACAGSGKTRTIIRRCEYLSNNNVDPSTIVLISFSRRSAQDIRNRVELLVPTLLNVISITTIDALSRKMLLSMNQTLVNVSVYTYQLVKLLQTMDSTYYDINHIFIDESQDLDDTQMEFLLQLKRLTNCSIHMIGDPNQCIYQFRNSKITHLINHGKKCAKIEVNESNMNNITNRLNYNNLFYLNENYRSSKLIIEYSQCIKPMKDETLSVAVNENPNSTITIYNVFKSNACEYICSGYSPKSCVYSDKFRLLDNKQLYNTIMDIIDRCDMMGINRSEIAFISPKRKGFMGLGSIYDFLRTKKYNVVQLYDESSDIEISKKEKKDNHINLLTYHGTKGLEFEVVLIFGMNNYLSGIEIDETDELENDINEYLLYVVSSRAKSHMYIFSNGRLSHLMNTRNNFDITKVNCFRMCGKTIEAISYDDVLAREPEKISMIKENIISVTSIIDRGIMSDGNKLNLFKYVNENVVVKDNITLFSENNIPSSSLLGIFCEKLFYFIKNKERVLEWPNIMLNIYKVKKVNKSKYLKILSFFKIHNIFPSHYIDSTSSDWIILKEIINNEKHECIMTESNSKKHKSNMTESNNKEVNKCNKIGLFLLDNKDKMIVSDEIYNNKKNIDSLRESYNFLMNIDVDTIKKNKTIQQYVKFSKSMIENLFYVTRFRYGISIQHYVYCDKNNNDKNVFLTPKYMKLYKSVIDTANKYTSTIYFNNGLILHTKNDIEIIHGIPDHYENDECGNIIVEIKTTKDNKQEHLIQLLLYSIMMNSNKNNNDVITSVLEKHRIKIINLLQSTITTYEFNIDPQYIINITTSKQQID